MNCMEALAEELKNCEPCKINSFIIDFKELPEEEKLKFSYYNKETDLILHCKECKIYKVLPERIDQRTKKGNYLTLCKHLNKKEKRY